VVQQSVHVALGEERDEFERTMSWKRAFQQIYTRYRWLHQFAQINKIAIETALNDFSAQILENEGSSLLAHQLTQFCRSQPIFHRKQETSELKQLVTFFAQTFTGTALKHAKRELERGNQHFRTKDLVPITLLSSVSLSLLAFAAFAASLPSKLA
jgi:hypothetical protein